MPFVIGIGKEKQSPSHMHTLSRGDCVIITHIYACISNFFHHIARIPRIAGIFPLRKNVGVPSLRSLNRPWLFSCAAAPDFFFSQVACLLLSPQVCPGLAWLLSGSLPPRAAHFVRLARMLRRNGGGNGFEFAQFKAIFPLLLRRRSRGRFFGLNAEGRERRMKGVTRRKLNISDPREKRLCWAS